MAVLPRKFQRGRGSSEARIEALEKYIEYMHGQLEHFASVTGKEITNIKNDIKDKE